MTGSQTWECNFSVYIKVSEMNEKTMLRFRERLLARERLIGSFIKTPTPHATEILGSVGFDFVVIDEEHAPIDRTATDMVLLGARAARIEALVRVRSFDATEILSALDCGASGVLVPHVASEARAKEVVAACRYRNGVRGFSPSGRAGNYGNAGLWEHIDSQDGSVAVIAMIEDREALEDIDAIVRVEGVDAVFIGRGDLAVALGATSLVDADFRAAVAKIMTATKTAGKPVCVMVGQVNDIPELEAQGATAFIVNSDQGLMKRMAALERAAFDKLAAGK